MTAEPTQPLTVGERVRVDEQNPWPGLASFTEQDSAFFNGRETETDQLYALTSRSRLTTLFGVSGLGKTSLLLAGVFPRLREQAILPVLIRLDYSEDEPDLVRQVFRAIHHEAEACGAEAPVAQAGDTLWEYFHREDADFWSSRNKLLQPLLVFDQFEEIFTLGLATPGRRRATERFVEALADLIEGRAPESVRRRLDADDETIGAFNFRRHEYKILLSLREDFLAPLEGLRKQMPAIVHNRYRLRRMTGEAAMTVVGAAEHLVTPEVAERIVRFVAAQDDGSTALEDLVVEPALLSVVSREFNNRRMRAHEDRITDHLIAGTAEEILDDVYDNGVDDFGDRTADVRAFIEDHLLTESGFRDSEALDNALTLPGIDLDVIQTLVNRRLLRFEDRDGVRRVELTHDLLTGVIRKSREARRREERAAEAAAERAKLAAERAKLRKQILYVLAGAAVCVVLAGVAWIQKSNADSWRDASRESLARTKLRLDEPDVAGLLLTRVEEPSQEARKVIRQVLQRGLTHRLTYPGDRELTFEQGTLTPNMRHALAVSHSRLALQWQLPQRGSGANGNRATADTSPLAQSEPVTLPGATTGILAFAVSRPQTGSEVQTIGVIGARDGSARIFHGLREHMELYRDANEQDPQPVWSAAVTPSGKRVALGCGDRTVRQWSVRPQGEHVNAMPGTVLEFAPDSDSENSPFNNSNETISIVALSPDGKQLAAASSQGRIVCWTGGPHTEPERHDLEGHDGAIVAAEFDAKSRIFVTGSWDQHVRVFELDPTPELAKAFALGSAITELTIAADGSRILAAVESGMVWEIRRKQSAWTLTDKPLVQADANRGPPVALSFRPDTQTPQFLLAYQNGGIEIHGPESEDVNILESNRIVRFAAWSQDGTRVLSSSSLPVSEELPAEVHPHELRVWYPQTPSGVDGELHAQLKTFFARHGFARISADEAQRLGLE
ncbi:MAG: hypothetical protein NXI31_14730 [bacterium]|nr:hypothetical protein [bacterium]